MKIGVTIFLDVTYQKAMSVFNREVIGVWLIKLVVYILEIPTTAINRKKTHTEDKLGDHKADKTK